jgi:hypothetical protein
MEERIEMLENQLKQFEENLFQMSIAQTRMVELFNQFIEKAGDNFLEIRNILERNNIE